MSCAPSSCAISFAECTQKTIPASSSSFVPDPNRVAFTAFDGFQPESSRFPVGKADAIEHSRDIVASIDSRCNEQAHFINKIGFEEGPINVATALE